jgi:hypothetical protein
MPPSSNDWFPAAEELAVLRRLKLFPSYKRINTLRKNLLYGVIGLKPFARVARFLGTLKKRRTTVVTARNKKAGLGLAFHETRTVSV